MNKNFRTYAFAWLYGMCMGIVFNLYTYYQHNVESLMPSRIRKLTTLLSLDIQEALRYLTEHSDHMTSYYLYQRLYGGVLGVSNPIDIMEQIWVCMFVLAYAIITVFVWHKYRSKILTLCAPVCFYLLSRAVLVTHHDDCTWFLAWAVYAILPLLAIFYDKGRELLQYKGYVLFIFITLLIAMLIGISNIGRLHSGLAISCVLLYMVFVFCSKMYNKKKAVLVGLMSLLIVFQGYSLFTATIPNSMMRLYGINSNINYFGPWHTLYIGLGWRNSVPKLSALAECSDKEAWKTDKNPAKIIYLDECADGFVKSKDSSIEYISKPYFEVLKTEYMRILTENTGWALINYLEKAIVCFAYVFYTQWRALLILSAIELILKKKNMLALSSSFVYTSAIFTMMADLIFGLIAIPTAGYLQGSMAALSLCMFVLAMDILDSLLHRRHSVFRRELL